MDFLFAVYKGCLCAEDERGRRFHFFPETLPAPNNLPLLFNTELGNNSLQLTAAQSR